MPLVIEVFYPNNRPMSAVIKTNAQPKVVEDILENWIREHLDEEADPRPAAKLDQYRVTIIFDPIENTFVTRSDTGNNRLTTSIVTQVWAKFGHLKVHPLI